MLFEPIKSCHTAVPRVIGKKLRNALSLPTLLLHRLCHVLDFLRHSISVMLRRMVFDPVQSLFRV